MIVEYLANAMARNDDDDDSDEVAIMASLLRHAELLRAQRECEHVVRRTVAMVAAKNELKSEQAARSVCV
jgi:hypothetical protein